MLTNDNNNIVLTPEQLVQIETTKTILLNLESEISIATKNLRTIKSESERAINDREYQIQLFQDISLKVESAKIHLTHLQDQSTELNEKLTNMRNDAVNITDQQNTKSIELTEREIKISKVEKELNEKAQFLNKFSNELNINTESFNTKVAKLKEVLSTL